MHIAYSCLGWRFFRCGIVIPTAFRISSADHLTSYRGPTSALVAGGRRGTNHDSGTLDKLVNRALHAQFLARGDIENTLHGKLGELPSAPSAPSQERAAQPSWPSLVPRGGSVKSEGKPAYSFPGLFFGQALCFRKYTRPVGFPPLQANLTGKSFVVSGGSSGIGFASAQALLRSDAKHVHILCRDLVRGEAAAKHLRAEANPGSLVSVHKVDVGVIGDVKRFAKQLKEPLDGIVNNAGALVNQRELNAEGTESHVAGHVIGLHALTKALAPKLLREGGCVVNVASAGLYAAKLHTSAIEDGFQDLVQEDGSMDGALAYAVCKRAQLELTKRWADVLPKHHIHAMHPGWCKTSGLDGLFAAYPSYKIGFENWRSAADGADTIVWLLAGQAPPDMAGVFFFDRKPAVEHQWCAGTRSSPADIERLWAFCEARTAEIKVE